MIKMRLIMLGRTRRPEVRGLLDDYVARIRKHAEIETTELRETSDAAFRKLKLPDRATVVLLDEKGKEFTSTQFAKWLGGMRDRGVREVVFLCGAAEGFPNDLRQRANQSISLSRLTMSYELARVLLTEQIYRAFTILAGHPYAK
ncbi:MAG TPA: 23S rRNA (pseudouridine(1915)-N(3))-methyltransferase RlmH [Candidatus Acidoferrales bacterium]|nr:23S rRNA (pseudouridine(1915)-N(3))-methyltransferase RlmH [Candidatus Acidoferrales bacterium]